MLVCKRWWNDSEITNLAKKRHMLTQNTLLDASRISDTCTTVQCFTLNEWIHMMVQTWHNRWNLLSRSYRCKQRTARRGRCKIYKKTHRLVRCRIEGQTKGKLISYCWHILNNKDIQLNCKLLYRKVIHYFTCVWL